MAEVLTLGVDIGSTASKSIMMRDGCEVLGSAVISSGAGTSGPRRAIEEVLETCGYQLTHMAAVCGTGYGRKSLQEADLEISELSCHAKGASFLCSDVRTVIDIGGQDAKVLSLSTEGRLLNFVMNDKCAAGTGRFLDVMARVLEADISELALLDKEAKHPVNISSTCTVFAESEVISYLATNMNKSDIIAGIHDSVARRVAGLARRIGITSQVIMTGGVAKNDGVVRALERALEHQVIPSPMAQHCGALGAALFAYEHQAKPKV